MIVFTLLTPCYVESQTARAYTAPLNVWRLLRAHHEMIDKLNDQFDACVTVKHSLLYNITRGFELP